MVIYHVLVLLYLSTFAQIVVGDARPVVSLVICQRDGHRSSQTVANSWLAYIEANQLSGSSAVGLILAFCRLLCLPPQVGSKWNCCLV